MSISPELEQVITLPSIPINTDRCLALDGITDPGLRYIFDLDKPEYTPKVLCAEFIPNH